MNSEHFQQYAEKFSKRNLWAKLTEILLKFLNTLFLEEVKAK